MSLSMEIAEDDGLAQFHQWLAILPENASELTLAAGRLTGQEREGSFAPSFNYNF
jgi:hypothetical protein